MGIFNKKKKENEIEMQKLTKKELAEALNQMALNEMDYFDGFFKTNNIAFDFNYFVSSVFSYYFSVWYVFLMKNNSIDTCQGIKKIYMDALIFLLSNACQRDHVDKVVYINHFEENIEKAINEAKNSIEENSFVDKGFTDMFLESFLNNNDILRIDKSNVTLRIMETWVYPVIKIINKTIITD